MPSLRGMWRPEAKNHALFLLLGTPKEKSDCRESDTALIPPGVLLAFQLRGAASSAAAPWNEFPPVGVAMLITMPMALGDDASVAPVFTWISPSASVLMAM